MNVLLLLSALLSALTGVNVGAVRVPVAAEQVALANAATAAVAIAPVVAIRPLQLVNALAARLSATRVVRLTVLTLAPYASRRRE